MDPRDILCLVGNPINFMVALHFASVQEELWLIVRVPLLGDHCDRRLVGYVVVRYLVKVQISESFALDEDEIVGYVVFHQLQNATLLVIV
jgi:hypothetical protein